MKKCMEIENIGSVWRVYAFFIRKVSVNQLNISCHEMFAVAMLQ